MIKREKGIMIYSFCYSAENNRTSRHCRRRRRRLQKVKDERKRKLERRWLCILLWLGGERDDHIDGESVSTYVLSNCSLSTIIILRDAFAVSTMQSARTSLVVAGKSR